MSLSKVFTVLECTNANLSQSMKETVIDNAFSHHINLPFRILEYARRTTTCLPTMSPFEHFRQLSLHF